MQDKSQLEYQAGEHSDDDKHSPKPEGATREAVPDTQVAEDVQQPEDPEEAAADRQHVRPEVSLCFSVKLLLQGSLLLQQ